jgi:Protein of unknown function (DUF1499)
MPNLRIVVGLAATAVVVGYLVLLAVLAGRSRRAPRLEPRDGQLKSCAGRGNCVNTQEGSSEVEPLRFTGSAEVAWQRLRGVVEGLPRTRLLADTEGYLRAESASRFASSPPRSPNRRDPPALGFASGPARPRRQSPPLAARPRAVCSGRGRMNSLLLAGVPTVNPPDPRGMRTEEGSCARRRFVVSGIASAVVVKALIASLWMTMTGRRPACSEPMTGSSVAHQISPRAMVTSGRRGRGRSRTRTCPAPPEPCPQCRTRGRGGRKSKDRGQ